MKSKHCWIWLLSSAVVALGLLLIWAVFVPLMSLVCEQEEQQQQIFYPEIDAGTVILLRSPSSQPSTNSGFHKRLCPWPKQILADGWPVVKVIAESPEKKYLAWGDDAGNVFVWEFGENKVVALTDLRMSAYDEASKGRILAIRFRDCNTLFWMNGEGVVWRARVISPGGWKKKPINLDRSGGCLSGIILEDSFIQCVSAINFFTFEDVLKEYELDSGAFKRTCKLYPLEKGLSHYVEAMAVSDDQKYLAIVSQCNAGLVSLDDFSLTRSFGIKHGTKIAISPDGSRVAVATYTNKLLVWDTGTGHLIKKLDLGMGQMPTSLVFVSNRRLLFEYKISVYQLDLVNGQRDLMFATYPRGTMVISSDRRWLYIGTQGALEIYKLVD